MCHGTACKPNSWELKHKDKEFRVTLSYKERLRLASLSYRKP